MPTESFDMEYWMMGEFPDLPCIPGIDPRTIDKKGGEDDDELAVSKRDKPVSDGDGNIKPTEQPVETDKPKRKNHSNKLYPRLPRQDDDTTSKGDSADDLRQSGWFL